MQTPRNFCLICGSYVWNKAHSSSFISLPLSHKFPKGARMNFNSPLPLSINEYFCKLENVPHPFSSTEPSPSSSSLGRWHSLGAHPLHQEKLSLQLRTSLLWSPSEKGHILQTADLYSALRRWLECIFSLHKGISLEATAMHVNERFPKGHWQYKM